MHRNQDLPIENPRDAQASTQDLMVMVLDVKLYPAKARPPEPSTLHPASDQPVGREIAAGASAGLLKSSKVADPPQVSYSLALHFMLHLYHSRGDLVVTPF
jgi:hypothetical protein